MSRKSLVKAADTAERIRHHYILKYNEQGGRCYICHAPLHDGNMQLAHRIPQRKWCLKKWGAAVIHHPKNMVLVCGLECNARAQLNPESLEAEVLAKTILREFL